MHELSLADALVRQAEEILEREHGTSVTTVTVVIGELSGVDRDAFAFAFPVAVESSALTGAELQVVEERAAVDCAACGKRTEPDLPLVRCAACGAADVTIVAGKIFTLQSMEIE